MVVEVHHCVIHQARGTVSGRACDLFAAETPRKRRVSARRPDRFEAVSISGAWWWRLLANSSMVLRLKAGM
jgi:hypothetical protein